MKYIDVEKLKEAIKRFSATEYSGELFADDVANGALDYVLEEIIPALQQEQPEIDLEEEMVSYYNEHFSPCENGVLLSEESGRELDCNDYESIARHFYELGLKARNEKN